MTAPSLAPGQHPFGTLPDGRAVEALVIAGGGLRVRLLTLGAILNDLRLDGVAHSLTLGADDAAQISAPMQYFGAIVGPVANRIRGAKARICGVEHHFVANEGGRTLLHGGATGTHAQIWQVAALSADAATLTLDLPDGFGGFPGNRKITARYAISEPGALDLEIEAATDAPTLFNFASHSYWNLDGGDSFAGHRLRIAATRYLPVDAHSLPTGTAAPVACTGFDFRQDRELRPGEDARLDHNFCLAGGRRGLQTAAQLTGASGVGLTLLTTEPGLQVYDAGKPPPAPLAGHDGLTMGAFAGLALEAQGWPDAPNHPGFPPICHDAGAPYRQHTRLAFHRPQTRKPKA